METNPSRLDQLLAFYAEDPQDPFTIYAIATEYRSSDPQKARSFYEILLQNHETYVGTYYHAAKLYDELGQKDDAERVYKKGLRISREEGNLHAFSELQQAYNTFKGMDYEDD
jgi:tetratricopeptide (TPR) repeat protein